MAQAARTAVIEFVDPVGEVRQERRALAPPLGTVDGKGVGIRIQWRSFKQFAQRFQDILTDRFTVPHVAVMDLEKPGGSKLYHALRTDKAVRQQEFDAFARGIQWAVLGLGA